MNAKDIAILDMVAVGLDVSVLDLDFEVEE